MIGSLIEIETKVVFDVAKITAAMARKTSAALLDAGQYAANVMRAGMRFSKSISPPGGFPFSHTGGLRDSIAVGFRWGTKLAIALQLDDVAGLAAKLVSGPNKSIAQLINEGGAVDALGYSAMGRGEARYNAFLSHRFKGGGWNAFHPNPRATKRGRRRRRVYRARPFVALTLPKASARLLKNMETFDFK